MFNKVLIANRGEIAIRIIHALKEMGISTVAVYSTVDKNAKYVKEADEAICIGGPQPKNSYLNMKNIISAALLTNSQAIHPGYGFLSESPDFAELCEKCHLIFIGPKSKSMYLMGNKVNARKEMLATNIPIIPGSKGVIKSVNEAIEVGKSIGYPVMLKAVAGGGGKGIRKVKTALEMPSAFNQAQKEAKIAFGDNRMYLEKLISQAKHIEIQIMADKYGKVITLPERDCSMQRNHQKIIEETPCPVITEKERDYLQELSIKAMKSINYENIGTIEFLMDLKRNFYFLEMNTRIQVEHAITEEVTQIDLIKEQVKIAAGEKLQYVNTKVKPNGAAIEVRINAENSLEKFLPQVGRINQIVFPEGLGIRIESGVSSGDEISPFYDSLIIKIISYAKDRSIAVKRLLNAIKEFKLNGLVTNKEFLLSLINSSAFQSGEYLIDYVDHLLLPRYTKNKKSKKVANSNTFLKYSNVNNKSSSLDIPNNLFLNCPKCKAIFYFRQAGKYMICPKCGYGFRVSAKRRLKMLTTDFVEWDSNIKTIDPLHFPGYKKKLDEAQSTTKLREAILVGQARLKKYKAAIGIMDPLFMMGSLGTATGEKITRLFERATVKRLPVILFTASGGARMQEGILSLMQMAKISQAINEHRAAGLIYISIIMDPTTGGVTASFASQADIIIGEPKALLGFAGRRVIEQTTNEKLSDNFQSVENAYANGFIDAIVPRDKQFEKICQILNLFSKNTRDSKNNGR